VIEEVRNWKVLNLPVYPLVAGTEKYGLAFQ